MSEDSLSDKNHCMVEDEDVLQWFDGYAGAILDMSLIRLSMVIPIPITDARLPMAEIQLSSVSDMS